MIRRPPNSTRTATLVPYTTLFRSAARGTIALRPLHDRRNRNLEPTGHRTATVAGLNRRYNTFTKVIRIGSGHACRPPVPARSEEHTSELQSLMRTSYAVLCLKKKINNSKIKTSALRRQQQTQ